MLSERISEVIAPTQLPSEQRVGPSTSQAGLSILSMSRSPEASKWGSLCADNIETVQPSDLHE